MANPRPVALSEDVVKPIVKVLVYECDNGMWQAEAINAGALGEGRTAQLAILRLCEDIESLYQYSLESGEPMTFDSSSERQTAFDTGVDPFPDEGRRLQFAVRLVRELGRKSGSSKAGSGPCSHEGVEGGFRAELCLASERGGTWNGHAGRPDKMA